MFIVLIELIGLRTKGRGPGDKMRKTISVIKDWCDRHPFFVVYGIMFIAILICIILINISIERMVDEGGLKSALMPLWEGKP